MCQAKPRYNRTCSAPSSAIGLIQMACSVDPNENLAKAEWRIREAAGTRRADRLPAGTVPLAVFLPRGRRRAVRPGRADPRARRRKVSRGWRANWRWSSSARVFERRAAGVYHNTALVIDADGALLGIYRKMHIPDDPLYFEKYYFTPGDLGFRCFDTRYRAHRAAGLLGPVVSGSGAAGRAGRRAGAVLPDGHRLAPGREGRQYGAAQHDAWRTIQRAHAIANGAIRGGREPRGLRRAAGAGPGILGRLVRGRSVRPGAGRGVVTTEKRCWSWNATRGASKKCAATGRFCATAASTRTSPSSTG